MRAKRKYSRLTTNDNVEMTGKRYIKHENNVYAYLCLYADETLWLKQPVKLMNKFL